jgi:hypothetical protein
MTTDERMRDYLTRAEEARKAAEETVYPDLKATYLRIAEGWERLAEETMRRR